MNILKYFSLIFLIAGLSSCAKLKEDPGTFITAEEYYKTKADAINAVNAAYFLLNSGGPSVQTPYNTLFATGMDFMSDDIDPGPGATNADVRSQAVLNHSSTGLRVLQLWQQHYAGIKKANIAIDKVPEIADPALTPALKTRLVGEAKLLRALYYFNLVRLFGGVPLILHDQPGVTISDFQIARNSVAEVYAQVEQDFIAAAAVLPDVYTGADIGRATAGAAKSLLSKVYLTQEKWTEAAAKAEEVTGPFPYGPGSSPYRYDLFADYAQVFLPAYKNGKEHIFSAQFKSNSLSQGNNQAPRGARSGVPGMQGSYTDQVRFYTEGTDKFFSIYKLYEAHDQRKKRGSFVTRFLGSDGKWYGDLNDKSIPGDSIPYLNKYWDPDQSANLSESAANVPIIRYSEVLLILAEAENEAKGPTAKAYAAYNRLRERAGLTPVSGLNKNQFREALYLDRRLELVWENQRWFDLIREKDASGKIILEDALRKVGKVNVSVPKHLLFPIPQQEIDLNRKLIQNPGW
ncbi:RagB/SusD family nutrient uptake outer membrane protein [Pedobacter steynii]|uniref:Carbohydrate-binding protein SusD n=1 Tax=Pedobacter steynii TaxID=430522 RepID=A0A1D7QII8_9SPHI|nr:RagB/SusD family nutrient uptake outer membrane protein [Pedobacter steynii]AOM78488.1 carbohydrate-binding protein SusD [Pedobacter steynii]